jgi:tetratricopeptide (TPR) repeat protein
MSTLLAEPTRLSGGSRSLSILPTALRIDHVAIDFPALPSEPGFVVRARALVEAAPASAIAHVRLAQAEQATGNDEAARAAALRALDIQDEMDEAVILGAVQVLLSVGDADAAESTLARRDQLLNSPLGARLAIHRGELATALERLAGHDTYDALATRAWVQLELRQFTDAIRTLRLLLREADPTASALTNIGYAYAAVGSLPKAISATREAIQLDPQSLLIGLNLISYYRSAGDLTGATSELARLQKLYPTELKLAFVEADLRLKSEDVEGAQKVLRRARTSTLWISAPRDRRSELEANLAVLRWRRGDLTREDAKKVVLDQLEREEFANLAVVALLPWFFYRTDQVDELETLLRRLHLKHPRESFASLRLRLKLLEGHFEEAVVIAVDWASEAPFSSNAAAMAVYLLTEVDGDIDRAFALGLDALKRHPAADGLRNNVSYALAVSGRLDDAVRLLPRSVEHSVHLTATRALIDVLRGNVDAGLRGYELAHQMAIGQGNQDLAEMVLLNRALAILRARASAELIALPVPIEIELPNTWTTNPTLVLLKGLADQEGITARVND